MYIDIVGGAFRAPANNQTNQQASGTRPYNNSAFRIPYYNYALRIETAAVSAAGKDIL